MENYYIKTKRTFTFIRNYGWFLTLLIAIGGLWVPKLGLLVLFIMAGLTITGFFTGRYWCGNFCPHGSLFDRLYLPLSGNKKIPDFFKSKPFIVGFFIFFMLNFIRKMVKVFSLWGSMDFLDKLGLLFVNTYLMVVIAGGILSLLFNSRTWCQFCPMGSIQKLSYKLGGPLGVNKKTDKKITIANVDMCHSCGKCARVCPFQLTPYLEFSEENQFDNINCIKCATCVENCPANILSVASRTQALEIKELNDITGYENRQTIKSKIKDIKDLGKNIKEYTFTFEEPQKVHYKSGQFILIKIQDVPKAFRAYSISSFNEDSRTLSVIIKKVEKGYGTEIIFNNFKIGDIIELEGPMGDELVPNPLAEKIVFVANGIGITPFIGLTKDVLLNHQNVKELILLDGQRYENELLYREYFEDLERKYDKFKYMPILSRDKESKLKKGYVTEVLNELNLSDNYVYMCGSKNMIKDSYDILISSGISKDNIAYESEERIKM